MLIAGIDFSSFLTRDAALYPGVLENLQEQLLGFLASSCTK
jgi:hypothetical protein